MNELAYLLRLTQEELKIELYDYLRRKKMNPVFEDGFVYAEGEIPILLVAHMDTVFENPPVQLLYDKKEKKLFNPNGGLGGDDRCGIYAILQLLEKFKPYVLFTEDEEIGCVGAEKAIQKINKPNVKYIIEFDRRGKDDCVFYECGNEKFIDYIESFNFKINYGSYSDISVLGSAWDIAAVNLSCGYYNEHTSREYVIFDQLQKTIKRAKHMLNAIKNAPYFDYQEIRYDSNISTYYFYDDGFSDDKWNDWFDKLYDEKNDEDNSSIQEKSIDQNPKQDCATKKLILKKNNITSKDEEDNE